MEAAICLHEAITNEKFYEIESYLLNNGSAKLRYDLIVDCAPKLEAAYQKAVAFFGEHGQCFDLDIVPRILREVIRVSLCHIAPSAVWDEAAVKAIWISEFDDILQAQYKTSVEKEPLDQHAFFMTWGKSGTINVDAAAMNYASYITKERTTN